MKKILKIAIVGAVLAGASLAVKCYLDSKYDESGDDDFYDDFDGFDDDDDFYDDFDDDEPESASQESEKTDENVAEKKDTTAEETAE